MAHTPVAAHYGPGEAPACPTCGGPLIRGVNSDYCSEACERPDPCAVCGEPLPASDDDRTPVVHRGGATMHEACAGGEP